MVFGSKLVASAVGALALSSGALGRDLTQEKSTTNVDSVSCSVIAIGGVQAPTPELYVELGTEASAYVCNGVGSAAAIAEKTASTFAAAIAFASIQCKQTGKTSAVAEAKASAQVEAEVFVSSYFSAFAEASTCGTCDAFAYSSGYVSKWVFLSAVAKAEAKLESYTYGDDYLTHITSVQDYQKDVETVVATAFSESLAAAAKFHEEEGCLAFTNAAGCIWTEGHPDEETYCAGCTALSFSTGAVDSVNALSEVSAEALAYTCDDAIAKASVEVTATALAKASAQAISFAFAECAADTGGYACASADTDVSVWVEAIAESYANSLALALGCKAGCFAQIKTNVGALGSVLVDAATSAWAALCVSEDEFWTVEDLEIKIVEASLCAIAEANAFALSIGGDLCVAGGFVNADATQHVCPDVHYPPY